MAIGNLKIVVDTESLLEFEQRLDAIAKNFERRIGTALNSALLEVNGQALVASINRAIADGFKLKL